MKNKTLFIINYHILYSSNTYLKIILLLKWQNKAKK